MVVTFVLDNKSKVYAVTGCKNAKDAAKEVARVRKISMASMEKYNNKTCVIKESVNSKGQAQHELYWDDKNLAKPFNKGYAFYHKNVKVC